MNEIKLTKTIGTITFLQYSVIESFISVRDIISLAAWANIAKIRCTMNTYSGTAPSFSARYENGRIISSVVHTTIWYLRIFPVESAPCTTGLARASIIDITSIRCMN